MPYLGEYHYTLDASNRIILPSRFRAPLGTDIILYKAEEGCLYIYDLPTFEKITAPLAPLSRTHDGRLKLRRFYSDVATASLDRSGRLVVPAECIEHAGLKEDVVVLGTNNKIEVWSLDRYNETVGDTSLLTLDEYPEVEF